MLSILRDLNAVLESSEKQGFRFLSYLLRMAVLEAQSIASTPCSTTKTDSFTREHHH